MYARRDNRIIHIKDSAEEQYAKEGYAIYAEDGVTLVREPEVNTMGEARKSVMRLREQLAERDKRIAELEEQLAATKTTRRKAAAAAGDA